MHSCSPWRCNQTEVEKRGQGEVMGAQVQVPSESASASSGPVQSITVAFLLQSPDRKKALTAQRTFDSEGESNHPGCAIAPFGFMPQISIFFSPLLPFCAWVCCRGGAVPELPGEGPTQRLGRGVQGTQTRQRHRGAVQAHPHLLEPAQCGQTELSRLPHIPPASLAHSLHLGMLVL